MNEYYVYALVDPRTNQPFYIGKGKRYKSGNERAEVHLTPAHKANRFKRARIDEIRTDGIEPKIEYIERNMDETSAYELEVSLIDKYGRIKTGGILTNIARDRRPPGMAGKRHSQETRDEYSRSRKGRTHRESTKQLMSSQRVGSKNANALYWKVTTPDGETFEVHGGLKTWCETKGFKFQNVYCSTKGFKTEKFGQSHGGPGRFKQ